MLWNDIMRVYYDYCPLLRLCLAALQATLRNDAMQLVSCTLQWLAS